MIAENILLIGMGNTLFENWNKLCDNTLTMYTLGKKGSPANISDFYKGKKKGKQKSGGGKHHHFDIKFVGIRWEIE